MVLIKYSGKYVKIYFNMKITCLLLDFIHKLKALIMFMKPNFLVFLAK